MRRYLLLLFALFCAINTFGQQYSLSGRITDGKNNIIPFASVYIRNSTYGTAANEAGRYEFRLSPGEYTLMYRFVGYKEKTLHVTIGNADVVHNVQMQDEVYNLKEVIISGGKRSEDPGMEIMRQAVKKREYYLNEIKGYSCAVYIKGVQKLLKAPKMLLGKEVAKVLDLDSNGRGILYQSESLSEFNFERPDKVREITIASKVAGQSTAFSYNKASDLQVNLYENIFTINGLSSRGFVSPVADNAFNFYRFKLEGSTEVNGKTIDKIRLIPRRKYSQAFQGNIYIIHGDWRIYSADLTLTSANDNINLIDTLNISQQYIPVKDDVWLPVSVHFDFNGSVLGFKFAGYFIGVYNNYKIAPTFEPGFFNGEVLRVDTAANKKDSTYWAETRPVPLTRQEARDYVKKDSTYAVTHTDPYLDSAQTERNKFGIPAYLIFGYDAAGWRSKRTLHIEPFYKTVFYNTVEGWGIDLQVRYMKKIDQQRNYTLSPTLHYGFSSKLFSPNISGEYVYDKQQQGKFYGSMGADVLDLSNVGTRSLFFNTVSSLIYENNYVKYYRSKYGSLGYQRELANGILWDVSLSYANRQQLYNTSFNHIIDSKVNVYTSNNPLAPMDEQAFLFPTHNALTLKTAVTFTFNQRYITRPDGKIYMPSAYPKVVFNYRKGINTVFGSDVNYDFASVDISQDHISLGLYGSSSFKITAGNFFNKEKLYFMDYNHFLGNMGLTFDPTYVGSFHYLPFYEFSTNSGFVEAHYFHNFSGVLFNQLAFMRRLKLEEVAGFNYLNSRNRNNYTELYVGIQRLFFRVDYGISFLGNNKYIQGFRLYYGIR